MCVDRRKYAELLPIEICIHEEWRPVVRHSPMAQWTESNVRERDLPSRRAILLIQLPHFQYALVRCGLLTGVVVRTGCRHRGKPLLLGGVRRGWWRPASAPDGW